MAKKIKNPEKYIERLRGQLQKAESRAREYFNELIQVRGKLQVVWQPHFNQQSCDSNKLGSFRAGDTILIVGTVTKVEETFDPKCNNRSSCIGYIVRETRRREVRDERD